MFSKKKQFYRNRLRCCKNRRVSNYNCRILAKTHRVCIINLNNRYNKAKTNCSIYSLKCLHTLRLLNNSNFYLIGIVKLWTLKFNWFLISNMFCFSSIACNQYSDLPYPNYFWDLWVTIIANSIYSIIANSKIYHILQDIIKLLAEIKNTSNINHLPKKLIYIAHFFAL